MTKPFHLHILPGMPGTMERHDKELVLWLGTVRRRLKKMTPELWAEIKKRPGLRRIEGYLFEGHWRDDLANDKCSPPEPKRGKTDERRKTLD